MRRWLLLLAVFACAGAAGCKGSSLKGAGEECVASSECQAGLLCDFGQDPPVCAGEGTGDGDGDGT